MLTSMRNTMKAKVNVASTSRDLKVETRNNVHNNTRERSGRQVGAKDGAVLDGTGREETAATNVNIPGIKYVFGRRIPLLRRLIWLGVLCGMSYLLFRQCYKRVGYFLTNPTIETSRLVYPQKLRFPAVTVCNQNFVRASFALSPVVPGTATERPILVYELLHKYFEAREAVISNITLMSEYMDEYSYMMPEELTLGDIYGSHGHQRKDFLIRCTFKGLPCKEEWFKDVFTDAGLCFTFNSDDANALHTELHGHRGGLQMELNYETHEYLHSVTANHGAIILIHDQAESSRLVRNKGITIPAGISVSVGLSVSNRTSDGKAHGRCGNTPLKNFPPSQRYLRSICELDCLTEYIKAECGCLDVYMPGYIDENQTEFPRCTIKDTMTCAFLKTDQFPSSSEYPSYCQCETPCDMTLYQNFISFAITSLERSALRAAKQSIDSRLVREYRTGMMVNDWAFLLNAGTNYLQTIHSIIYRAVVIITQLEEIEVKVNESMSSLHNLEFSESALNPGIARAMNRTYRNDLFSKSYRILVDFNRRLHNRNYTVELLTVASILTANELMSNTAYKNTILAEMMALVFHMANASTTFRNATAQQMAMPAAIINETERALLGDVLIVMDNASAALRALQTEAATVQMKYEVLLKELQDRFGAIYAPWNQEVMSSQFVRENFGTVAVYFPELYVREIKESTNYDVIALMCDLGGSLGLCLGGSLLTLVEIIDLFFGRFLFCSRYNGERK